MGVSYSTAPPFFVNSITQVSAGILPYVMKMDIAGIDSTTKSFAFVVPAGIINAPNPAFLKLSVCSPLPGGSAPGTLRIMSGVTTYYTKTSWGGKLEAVFSGSPDGEGAIYLNSLCASGIGASNLWFNARATMSKLVSNGTFALGVSIEAPFMTAFDAGFMTLEISQAVDYVEV